MVALTCFLPVLMSKYRPQIVNSCKLTTKSIAFFQIKKKTFFWQVFGTLIDDIPDAWWCIMMQYDALLCIMMHHDAWCNYYVTVHIVTISDLHLTFFLQTFADIPGSRPTQLLCWAILPCTAVCKRSLEIWRHTHRDNHSNFSFHLK